ncbi:MAG: hypothetical protein ACC628_14240 [Pirellulaceae bacterium]
MAEDPHRFREMIDACRPGGDDEGLPEMAPLAEQLERDSQLRRRFEESKKLDRAIQVAIGRVAVPTGLAERIVDAIEAAEAATAESCVDSDRESPFDERDDGDVQVASHRHHRGLFWMIGIPTAIAASAVVALVMLGSTPGQDLTTARTVAARVMHWTLNMDEREWRADEFPVTRFEPSAQLRLPRRRWQRVAGRTSHEQVVCYDVTSERQPRVYLFVIHTRQSFQGASLPPLKPDRNTRNWCFGVWQESGALYVVAVEGSEDRYRRIVRATLRFA